MISNAFATTVPSRKKQKPIPIKKWLWNSYLHAAIIPLLVVELSFLAIYWLSSSITYRENVDTIGRVSSDYLSDLARREALNIDARLNGIAAMAALFAAETRRALDGNQVLSARQRARLVPFAEGGLYTPVDDGTTGSFYSARNRIGAEHYAKIGRLSTLDGFLINAKRSEPLIASLYVNTADSYNLIYPYINAAGMIEPRTDVRNFNFYYEADAKNNPGRKPVWTDAYVDPAGHGWLVSALAPVWRGETLEAVVGIDIQLATIVERLLALQLPWGGYAMLIGKDGKIIAMPPAAERDLKLKDLRGHAYKAMVTASTFKPEEFNIARRPDTKSLFEAMQRKAEGLIELDLSGPRLASFADISGTHWKLVIVVPKSRVYANAESLNQRLHTVGYIMLAGLLSFYLAFFAFLYCRAKRMSRLVATPLEEVSQLLERIRDGQSHHSFAGSTVAELDILGRQLVSTGEQLAAARDTIIEQERIVSAALDQQRRINAAQTEFVRHMSHELRTPLAVIDSAAQIIGRKAHAIEPVELERRVDKMRGATQRIANTLAKLLSGMEQAPSDDEAPKKQADIHGPRSS